MNFIIKTVIYSVSLHAIVFYLLKSQTVNIPSLPHTQALKTYLVVESKLEQAPSKKLNEVEAAPLPNTDVIDSTSEHQKADETPTSSKASEAIPPATRPIKAKATATQTKKVQNEKTSINTPSRSKQSINPYEVLQSIRAKGLSYTAPHSSPTQQKRINVPIDHKNTNKRAAKIISQNQTFTEYQNGNTCFKVFNGDVNNRVSDSGITNQWQGLPYTCNNTAITQAYDKAMNKWLRKKP
ncbi:hypothetical protein PCIT_a0807 [Pseudoalteromonas citrea]|uniref:Uncharacterized protein n=2 Tax=Pseudoalteromonas citrea TaxID=43655 RepID=A0AAD4AL75_9GAMM|nr:hypothetical protein [Pseudoalteromonas citrea]KAF7774372.1 hypothetical protein PCIT_a0807 [Pseudoalteromonas citrea]